MIGNLSLYLYILYTEYQSLIRGKPSKIKGLSLRHSAASQSLTAGIRFRQSQQFAMQYMNTEDKMYSATQVLANEMPLHRNDPTAQSLDKQFIQLKGSVERIQKHLDTAIRTRRDKVYVHKISSLLANQQTELQIVADKLSVIYSQEPIQVSKARVLLDLSVDMNALRDKYGPVRKRWDEQYVNHGKLHKKPKNTWSLV